MRPPGAGATLPPMRTFAEILAIAAARKGSVEAVLTDSRPPLAPAALAAIPDDRWLAMMAKVIFQAGISWKMVEAKWPGIEAAFDGFAPGPLALMDDDRFDALLRDPRIIRSGAKVAAIRDNAAFVARGSAEHGGFGRRIADWPDTDFAGLLAWLGREGARLGGNSGAYVLRFMGRDGWILSRDVVARLVAEGVIDGPPGSQRAMAAVQAAFSRWQQESGLTLTQISRTLAQSIDADA